VVVRLDQAVAGRTTYTAGDSLGLRYMPTKLGEGSWRNALADPRVLGKDISGLARQGYVEAQMHGGVMVDDIASVAFRGTTRPDLAERLTAAGFRATEQDGITTWTRATAAQVDDVSAAARTFQSQADVDDWARAWQGDLRDIGDDVTRSLKDYSASDYSTVNDFMRADPAGIGLADETDEIASFVKTTVEAVERAMRPLPENVRVYRGVESSMFGSSPRAVSAALKPGSVLHEGGFMSTSTLSRVAQDFGDVQFRIRVPSGTRAVYMAKRVSIAPEEAELLLQRGATLTVEKTTRSKGGWIVEATLRA
jgi:hypothetical protein